LQQDFLPRRLPEVGPARFAVLYRPATWLSGDIYDVSRLDEQHVGFYVADAVGHGMPAALLTMFIKHALQTKRIIGNTYQIVPPEVSLSQLNADICRQNLTSCQFCTGIYCVLDTSKLVLTYCRAGHPPAILFRENGTIEHLNAPGSLLGVFPEETFQSRTLPLERGDRLVVFTDGAEEALRLSAGKPGADLADLIASTAQTPRDEMLLQLTQWIDAGKPGPAADDITIMVMDIEK
jgi:sigma-B regulation protein RsbU (phosphoserine phosphatase)